VSGGGLGGVRKATTDYYGFFVSWQHRFSNTFFVSASGGPTWVNSKQVFDTGGHDTSKNFDYFAHAQALAEFDRSSAAITYSRSSSDFANTSTAYFVDDINVTVKRSITQKFFLTAGSSWNQRTAVQKFSNASFVDEITQWRATGTASYELTRELRASLIVNYLRQDEANEDPIHRVLVSVRFRYNAKAIRF
jgi:hypothetical protein